MGTRDKETQSEAGRSLGGKPEEGEEGQEPVKEKSKGKRGTKETAKRETETEEGESSERRGRGWRGGGNKTQDGEGKGPGGTQYPILRLSDVAQEPWVGQNPAGWAGSQRPLSGQDAGGQQAAAEGS